MATDIIQGESVQTNFMKKMASQLQSAKPLLNSGNALLRNLTMNRLGYLGGQGDVLIPFQSSMEGRAIDSIVPMSGKKEKKRKTSKAKKTAKKKVTKKGGSKTSDSRRSKGSRKTGNKSTHGGKKSKSNKSGGRKIKTKKGESVSDAVW